ncbi:protein of unknown function [Cardinium endosymbiont cEper1 of Encarsia pergandiella]|nr:protein of unknown function [Cardinium endosymbiont cEper1 of Encarsia pergandiella]
MFVLLKAKQKLYVALRYKMIDIFLLEFSIKFFLLKSLHCSYKLAIYEKIIWLIKESSYC